MINYTKYLQCKDCQDSGLYCKEHKSEVKMELKKETLQSILELKNFKSILYRKSIESLLDLYTR